MKNKQITVFYKWTAKPGKLDELKAMYKEVFKAMNKRNRIVLKWNVSLQMKKMP
jgi:hypothetical protein